MKKQVFRRIFDQGQWNAKFAIPVSLLIYNRSFKYFSMGYGSALSWILFVIILIFTALTFKTSKHWVYYSDGEA